MTHEKYGGITTKGGDPTMDPTKDRAKGTRKVNRGLKLIRCNLESSHNFSIILEPNVLIRLPYNDLLS
jgi:hypothetical protein